jgi:hypothetical protein
MFTRPTTEQVLRGILEQLNETIAPELQTEQARITMGMITQVLGGCAARAGHEIGWMHDEGEAIAAAVVDVDDPATQDALAAYLAVPPGFHLDDAIARYHLAGEALSAAIEHAYRSGDQEGAQQLRALLIDRSTHEMQIVGVLDLVGRG